MQQLAPGFVARQMLPCNVCGGKGEIINGKRIQCVLIM